MLGRRSPQRGLFEADTQYTEFVGRDTFYGFLASQRGELFADEDFATLYTEGVGRPSVPPSLLATALVLQAHDKVSDEEAKQRADYDLRWKVALGVAVDARPYAKSSLQEFRARLVLHKQERALFERSLALAKRQGRFKQNQAVMVALDTTHILGRGAVKDTYNLLGDGIVQVARTLARLAGADLGSWAEEAGLARYVSGTSLKGEADLDWSDPVARQAFLDGVVADADRLLEQVRVVRATLAPESPADQELVAAAGLLARVLLQDIEGKEGGPALPWTEVPSGPRRAGLRVVQGVARDRLVSIHDPEMRHGRKSARKRFDGHKAQGVVDTQNQLITAVAVLPGNAPDAEGALAAVDQTEANTACQVTEALADAAYGGGATRQAFIDAGRVLVAKVPPITNRGRFPKTAFRIDLAAETCTCPAQQTTRDPRPDRGGGGTFHFASATCAACPLQARCVRGRRGRSAPASPGRSAASGAGATSEPGVSALPPAAPSGRASAGTVGPARHSAGAVRGTVQDAVPTGDGGSGGEPDAPGRRDGKPRSAHGSPRTHADGTPARRERPLLLHPGGQLPT